MSITPTNLNSLTGVGAIDVTGMDIETALMAVQSQRAQLLESQLTNQIKEVQNRNEQIAKLNNVLSALNSVAANFKGDAGATDKLVGKKGLDGKNFSLESHAQLVEQALADAGLDRSAFDFPADKQGYKTYKAGDPDPRSNLLVVLPPISAARAQQLNDSALANASGYRDMTKGQIDAAVNKVKGMIDAANNTNQMDMLRLQSLTNKRNEAFDVMSNFIKKMQDSRSSIIGNMR